MEIETIQNESAVCICTDVGLQPNTYLSTQYCSQCNGSGGSSNQPSMADYQQELLSLGVSPSYFQTIGNLPAMQNSTGNVPQQQQPQGTNNNTGQQPGQTQSPATRSLGASATAQTPIAGASAQGNLQPQMPTSTDNNQGQGTPYKYQLLNPYQESDKLLPQSFSFYISPPYAPFDNQFVSTSAQIQPDSSSTGSNQSPPSFGAGLSGGLYQPQTNFFGGNRGSGNSAQPSLTPGFSFASYSGQYTYLSARGGNSFVNCQS
ncbi:hypothetical protein V9T40_001822 [Parthenolecanium corni]|uniref:Uncharacterized protein n=1 Tax=Parthenolecanium corni TaxID=536013 RepID=A0AAN9Y3J1_9HEMI